MQVTIDFVIQYGINVFNWFLGLKIILKIMNI